jgi:hypothetical protein
MSVKLKVISELGTRPVLKKGPWDDMTLLKHEGGVKLTTGTTLPPSASPQRLLLLDVPDQALRLETIVS